MSLRGVPLAFLLLVLLLGALAVAIPGPIAHAEEDAACVLCSGAHDVRCPTCDGKGKLVRPCVACDGVGRARCSVKVHPKPKKRACSNPICKQGTITWEDGERHDCRLCGSGALLPCDECKVAAKQKCKPCGGKGEARQPCLDCSGTKSVPCLACETAPVCRACGGRDLVTCAVCKGAEEAELPCQPCLGRGGVVCSACAGSSKRRCKKCHGTGKMRGAYEDGSSAYSKGCTRCGKKGVVTCSRCKKGVAPCATCEGKRVAHQTCRECRGRGKTECGASGSRAYRVPEAQAIALEGKGDAAGALRLYRVAGERAERAVEKLDERLGTPPKAEPLPKSASAAERAVFFARLEMLALEFAALTRSRDEASDAAARASAAVDRLSDE